MTAVCFRQILTAPTSCADGGMRALAKDAKLIAETAAAITVGALLAGALDVKPEEKVCAVLSGGNWDLGDLAAVYVDR